MRQTITAMQTGGLDQPKVFVGNYQQVRMLTVPVTELVGRKPSPQFAHQVGRISGLHGMIQRDFKGAKRVNATRDLPDYVNQNLMPDGTWIGPVWKFDIWLPAPLIAGEELIAGVQEYDVDPFNMGFLLDGESRCYALESMYLAEQDEKRLRALLEVPLVIQVYDGLDADRAAQHFADLNGQGVGITPNLTLSHDIRDPWTKVARRVFNDLDIPLEHEARQVRRASDKVLTMLGARTMVAAVARGVSAVSYGAGPIPGDVEGQRVDFDRLYSAAVAWLGYVFETFGREAFRDPTLVLRAMPMIAAIGALGRPYYTGDSPGQVRARAILQEITDWSGGPRWNGIAGKYNEGTGRFSVGSGKETGYAAYRALTDPQDAGYRALRV
ncbi:DNA sulfur modification protein DndB [Actinomycetospora lutea]|uniref:DNA sulfur modification protein DndB n=1 Tax=Actinomycetospora lutea TaxID=663604 RepID=UPI00236562EA|nr:DNA sulfur modification protein DndB [Actinomycetospora lutea]MDD7940449.1 DNA sulfur modification protein DndB [Actinomycetospora lutea]